MGSQATGAPAYDERAAGHPPDDQAGWPIGTICAATFQTVVSRTDALPMTSGVTAARAAVPAPRTQQYARCAAARTVAEACEGMADDLRETYELPSIYLLVDGRLRCQAARGYFQVVDGFTPSAGIIGRVVARGESVHVEDAQQDPNFIAAIPGLAAEACVPVRVFDEVVGALSVESMARLPDDVVEQLADAAEHLGAAIERVGGMPPVPLAQRLARIAVGLTSLTDAAEIRRRAVDGACEVSGMSSASLSSVGPEGTWVVVTTAGPLSATLAQWTHEEHQVIAAWVEAGTSSHFPGGVDVPKGYEFLHRSDVRAIAVQPLAIGGRVTGLLITADTHPVPHDPSVGAAVELLAAQTAASLANAEAMAELSRRAEEDPLTGLRNAASFAAGLALDAAPGSRRCWRPTGWAPGSRSAASPTWPGTSTRGCSCRSPSRSSPTSTSCPRSAPRASPRSRAGGRGSPTGGGRSC